MPMIIGSRNIVSSGLMSSVEVAGAGSMTVHEPRHEIAHQLEGRFHRGATVGPRADTGR